MTNTHHVSATLRGKELSCCALEKLGTAVQVMLNNDLIFWVRYSNHGSHNNPCTPVDYDSVEDYLFRSLPDLTEQERWDFLYTLLDRLWFDAIQVGPNETEITIAS